jgi:hypothetical protein
MSKSGDERSDSAFSRERVGAVVRGAGKASVQLPVALLDCTISTMLRGLKLFGTFQMAFLKYLIS